MEVLSDEAYKEIMPNNNLYGDQKNQEEEENTKEKGRNEGPGDIEIDEESSSKGWLRPWLL